jgi:heterodisulfide reductase subunit B
LPQTALSGCNLAKARQQGASNILTSCAACYLNTHGVNEKIKNDVRTRQRVNGSLDAAGLSYDGDLNVRHVCEVLVNGVGLDKIKEPVTNPLNGLKVAGYVGCQTVRPFAGTDSGGNYDRPRAAAARCRSIAQTRRYT